MSAAVIGIAIKRNALHWCLRVGRRNASSYHVSWTANSAASFDSRKKDAPRNSAFAAVAAAAACRSGRHLLLPNDSSLVFIRHLGLSTKRFGGESSSPSSPPPSQKLDATSTTASMESTESTSTALSSEEVVVDFSIPDKPLPVEEVLSAFGEPSLQSLGLGSWWPSGRLQVLIDYIHNTLDVPWWAAITITTIIIRLCVFPLVVKSQKNMAQLNNHMPEMQYIQHKLTIARKTGNILETQKVSMELQKFMKEKNVNPINNFLPIGVMIPIFMSMFFALRGMANLPIASMESGGLAWFEDLTIADPFMLLPVGICLSTYLQLYFGADGAQMGALGPIAKKFMMAVPIIIFPFVMNFPTALTWYWFNTNLISVVQAKVVRNDLIRDKLGIPKLIDWKKKKNKFDIPEKKKGFRESFHEMIDNMKVQHDVADRRQYDEHAFRQAGESRKVKTYKFNPTQPITSQKK